MQDKYKKLAFLAIFYTILMIIKEINELSRDISFSKSVDFRDDLCIISI